MTRFTLYFIKMVIAVISALILTSCNITINDGIEPKGDVITKNVAITDNFNKIKVSNGLNVIVTQSKTSKVSIEAQENLIEYIEIFVDNETLIIKKNKNFKSNSTKNIYVLMPKITKIKASSASSVVSTSVIKSRDLELEASSAGSIEIEIVSENLEIDTSSGAQIIVKGKAVNLDIEASSGAYSNTENLISKDARLKASSGATIKVNTINKLDAKASSGASILYKQSPNNLTIKESSGGNIRLN